MKKLVVTAALTFCAFVVFAQSVNKDIASKFRFGFNLGANYSFLQSKETLPSNAEAYNGVGVKFGVFMDYSISKNLLISPKTELALNKSGVETSNSDNSISTYKVFPLSVDIMTHFVYKIGYGKTIPYLLAGPNFRLPLNNKPKSSTDFKNNPDFAIDFGIGIENSIKNFIFAPEIRYSLGLLNVNKNPTFQTFNYHNISLVLNFK
jgi:predicted small secreted protein